MQPPAIDHDRAAGRPAAQTGLGMKVSRAPIIGVLEPLDPRCLRGWIAVSRARGPCEHDAAARRIRAELRHRDAAWSRESGLPCRRNSDASADDYTCPAGDLTAVTSSEPRSEIRSSAAPISSRRAASAMPIRGSRASLAIVLLTDQSRVFVRSGQRPTRAGPNRTFRNDAPFPSHRPDSGREPLATSVSARPLAAEPDKCAKVRFSDVAGPTSPATTAVATTIPCIPSATRTSIRPVVRCR